jgi:hypothetical protein
VLKSSSCAETPPNANFVHSLPHNLEKLETRLPLFCAELHIDAQGRAKRETPIAAFRTRGVCGCGVVLRNLRSLEICREWGIAWGKIKTPKKP